MGYLLCSRIRLLGISFVASVISSSLTADAFSFSKNIQRPLTSQRHHDDSHNDDCLEDNDILSRRSILQTICTTALLTGMSRPAEAYRQAYPLELDDQGGDLSRDLRAQQMARAAAKKEKRAKDMNYVTDINPFVFRNVKDFLSCAVWGGALWLLGGSRSNPLVTPLANIFYDEKEEKWLKDRNDGLFATVPVPLLVLAGLVFFVLGILTDRFALLLAEGSANVSLQLAGVTLIGGAALELGRVASGEKRLTREDFDRETRLAEEFAEFAQQRLQRGGNVHRSEVTRAFRRYYTKYRVADGYGCYPLTDLEIERLLRNWNLATNTAVMSSAGFYSGISIDPQADAFAN